MLASLGSGVKGEFDGISVLGGMTNKLLQLRHDVYELLPKEIVNEMSKVADEWAAKQREKLIQQQKIRKQHLKAAREIESYEDGQETSDV